MARLTHFWLSEPSCLACPVRQLHPPCVVFAYRSVTLGLTFHRYWKTDSFMDRKGACRWQKGNCDEYIGKYCNERNVEGETGIVQGKVEGRRIKWSYCMFAGQWVMVCCGWNVGREEKHSDQEEEEKVDKDEWHLVDWDGLNGSGGAG